MQKMRIFTPGRILGIVLGVIVLLFVTRMGNSVNAYQVQPSPTVAQTQAPTPTPPPAVQVVMNETYINALVKQQLVDNPNVSDPVVDLRPPNLALVTVTMRLQGGFSVRPTATIAFTVQKNKIVVNVQRVNVSGIGVPRVLIENQLLALQTQLENQLNQLTQPLDTSILELDQVTTSDTELTVDLGFRPSTGLTPEASGTPQAPPFPIVTSTPQPLQPQPINTPTLQGAGL